MFQSAYRLYYAGRWFPDTEATSRRPRVALD
jgi:hypothetical protein